METEWIVLLILLGLLLGSLWFNVSETGSDTLDNRRIYHSTISQKVKEKLIVPKGAFIRKLILQAEETDVPLMYIRAIPVLINEVLIIMVVILGIIDQLIVDFISLLAYYLILVISLLLFFIYSCLIRIIAHIFFY